MNRKASILSEKKIHHVVYRIRCYTTLLLSPEHENVTELLFFHSAFYYVSILFNFIIDNFTSTKCSYVYHKYLEMYTGKFRGI